MATDELVNLCLRALVQVLELVHRAELDHVQPVRQDPVWFPLQQMFALVRCNVADSRENIGAVAKEFILTSPKNQATR